MKHSRKITVLLLAVLLAFAVALTMGCSGKTEAKGAKEQAADVTQGMDKKLKMAMIVHDTTSPFQAFFIPLAKIPKYFTSR